MAMNQSSNMQSGRTRRRWRAGIGRRKHGGQISSATFLRIVGNTVKALDWIQKDYEVSERFLPDKDLFPTCNTLGELHLRLENFKEALYYQEKHLEIAEGANNLAEQQRANTQLGRTYHEIFLKSQDNHSAVQNAKKYFILAIELAKNLKENQWSSKSTFLTEYIDAHNNLGMLEIDLNNLEEAESILTKGLEICDEEEVGENDDGRSRLHHNLGLVYMEFRNWKKAEEHIKKDILICESIRHCQGEAKGLINFGELHGRVQKYEEAISCYQKALLMAKSMEDEGALVDQIELNIETVEAAIIVMKELKQGEQNLKRIQRCTEKSKDKACERKYLLQQIELVDLLIQKSSSISAWIEGQELSKIEMGNVMDSAGRWKGALEAFEEAYRIASEASIASAQLSALKNMHYSYMIRYDEDEKARMLQISINNLKHSTKEKKGAANICSETEEKIESQSSGRNEVSNSSDGSLPNSSRSNSHSCPADLNEDAPLISLLHHGKKGTKFSTVNQAAIRDSIKLPAYSPKSDSTSAGIQAVGCKRRRAVPTDCQEEENRAARRPVNFFHEDEAAASTAFKKCRTARNNMRFRKKAAVPTGQELLHQLVKMLQNSDVQTTMNLKIQNVVQMPLKI